MSGTRWPEAVVDTLYIKCCRALRETGLKRLVAVGGVSANRALRSRLAGLAEELGVTVHYPRPELCTDNGAMVATRATAACREVSARPSPSRCGHAGRSRT